jgi:hypothetical protein
MHWTRGFHGAAFASLLALAGCAAGAQYDQALKRDAETTASSGWRVDCTDDQTLDVRRCFAAKFSGDSVPFQVYYYDKEGPFILAGFHTDPVSRAAVRVDDFAPVVLTNSNQYSFEISSKARRAEAERLVADLQRGKVARVRYHAFPASARDTTIDLTGFPEVHDLLLKTIAEKGARP